MSSPRHLVAESYDHAAPRFAAAADRHVYALLAQPLVEAVTNCAEIGDGPVLDVAAGTGAVGRHFARTVAVDVSLEQLRRNGAPVRVRADAEQLPFPARPFAAAVCGFGVNQVANPEALVGEMARIAPVVAVLTWARPEIPYAPKQIVFDALARRIGHPRSPTGDLLDRYGDGAGSVDVVADLFGRTGLRAEVTLVEVLVPWPGAEACLDYRLSMPTMADLTHKADLLAELEDALTSLPPDELTWRPQIIVGVGLPENPAA